MGNSLMNYKNRYKFYINNKKEIESDNISKETIDEYEKYIESDGKSYISILKSKIESMLFFDIILEYYNNPDIKITKEILKSYIDNYCNDDEYKPELDKDLYYPMENH